MSTYQHYLITNKGKSPRKVGGKRLSLLKKSSHKSTKYVKKSSHKRGGIKCSSGQVIKKSYTTKKGTIISETCIRDLGKPGKYITKNGEKPIKLSTNDLSIHGYFDIKHKTNEKRRTALKKAVVANGYLKVMRKVNALSVLTKTTDPIFSHRTRQDVEWLKKTFSIIN